MPSQPTGGLATTLGRNIRSERLAQGLTQRRLAERIETDPMQVSKWERGQHRPSEVNLTAIAREFGRDVGWFYTDHDSEKVAA